MKKLFFLALSPLALVGLFDLAHAMNKSFLREKLIKMHENKKVKNNEIKMQSEEVEERLKTISNLLDFTTPAEEEKEKPKELSEMINLTMESEEEKQKFTERLKGLTPDDIVKMAPNEKKYHLVCASRLGNLDFFQKFLEQVTINQEDARVILLGALYSPTTDLIKMLLSNETFMQKIDNFLIKEARNNLNELKTKTEGPEYCKNYIMLRLLEKSKEAIPKNSKEN